jgi:hypothetical protein
VLERDHAPGVVEAGALHGARDLDGRPVESKFSRRPNPPPSNCTFTRTAVSGSFRTAMATRWTVFGVWVGDQISQLPSSTIAVQLTGSTEAWAANGSGTPTPAFVTRVHRKCRLDALPHLRLAEHDDDRPARCVPPRGYRVRMRPR